MSELPMIALLDFAFERIAAREKTLFSTANAHSVVSARRLPRLAAHYRAADAVLPDGISVVWAARASGGGIPERVAGPDFFEAFLARAAVSRVSVFFVGATEDTLHRLCRRCRARWPELQIAGAIAPPYGPFGEDVDEALVDAVNAAGADALFVAMTAPKQELWLSRNLWKLQVSFAMGVGAAFDFLSGTKRRAPPVVGRLGLEWLYRLAHEPRRLWRRNVDSGRFLALVARERFVQSTLNARASAGLREPRGDHRRPVRRAVSISGRPGRCVDVSGSGMCIELAQPLPPGASVDGTILLEEAEMRFAGQVVWKADAGSRHPGRIGVRFSDVPPDLADGIH